MADRLTNSGGFAKRLCALLALALIFCLVSAGPGAAAGAAGAKVFVPLKADLMARGISKKDAQRLLRDKRLKNQAKLMARMLSVSESKLNYQQFLGKANVKKGRKFMKKHRRSLARAREITKVEPGVVVSILSVESRLGRYTGKYLTVNMLASQAVLDTKQGQKELARYWPKKRRKEIYTKKTQARLKRRATWARKELAAALRLARKWRVDPFALKGSAFGALGMCQFVPSSVLNHARDGNGDGRINLKKPDDAIISVATYLKNHGWRPGLSRKDRMAVIMKYNNSTPYSRTVLELARRLK